jgi:MtN3 and saliva related transmembrane protein
MANFIEIVFSFSLVANAALFIPQAVKIYKRKSAYGVSLITFAGFNFIQLATVFHAYLAQDWILFWGYIISLIAGSTVTALIIKYRGNKVII